MSKPIKMFLNRDRTPVLCFLIFAILISGSIIVAARLNAGPDRYDVNSVKAPTAPSQRRVQIVRFTLYDAGIYPQEVRANPGRLTISLEDLTASSAGVIVRRIEENARVPAGVAIKAPNSLRSRSELNVLAGSYEVVDATRPDNLALLIVQN